MNITKYGDPSDADPDPLTIQFKVSNSIFKTVKTFFKGAVFFYNVEKVRSYIDYSTFEDIDSLGTGGVFELYNCRYLTLDNIIVIDVDV